MGGHHESEIPKVPDYRIYRVEDVPELMTVKKLLARDGLHDPWLRNEVWRYTEFKEYTRFQRLKNLASAGFKYGLVAAIITAGIEYSFFPIRKIPGDEGHGHH